MRVEKNHPIKKTTQIKQKFTNWHASCQLTYQSHKKKPRRTQMSTKQEAITKFDEQIMDTLYHCIMKISEHLKNAYDPDSPESNALFRLYCSAVRTNIQMTNKYLKDQSKENLSQNQNQNSRNMPNNNQTSFKNIPNQKANASCPTQNNNKTSFWRKKKTA